MSVLLVSYDLKGDDSDYHQLIQALESYGHGRYCHAQKSVWLLDTSKTPREVASHLGRYMNLRRGDKIFVGRIHKDWSSYCSDDVANWLKGHSRTWD